MPRRQRVKGASETVAAAMLMLIAIALAVSIWFFSQRFVGGGDVASARAVVTQNTFVGTSQVVTLSVRLDSKSDSPLFIRAIRIVTDRGGSLTTIVPYSTATATAVGSLPTATATGGVSFGFAGENYVRPRQTMEFAMTINFGASYVTSIQVIIELMDPTARVYTVTSNEVKL